MIYVDPLVNITAKRRAFGTADLLFSQNSNLLSATAKHDMHSSTTDSHSSMLSDFAKIMPSILPKTYVFYDDVDSISYAY